MRIAYLINQYPKVSHTSSGAKSSRSSAGRRGRANRVARLGRRAGRRGRPIGARTHAIRAARGAASLLWLPRACSLTRPLRLLRALALAWRMGRRAERPLPFTWPTWPKRAALSNLVARGRFSTCTRISAPIPPRSRCWCTNSAGRVGASRCTGRRNSTKRALIGLAEKVRRCAFVVAVSSYGRSQLTVWSSTSTGQGSASCTAAWSAPSHACREPARDATAWSASAGCASRRASCC